MFASRFAVAGTLIATVLPWGASEAKAAPITFGFSGRVTQIVDNGNVLGADVVVGNSFFGTYTFESTLTDSYAPTSIGRYASASSAMQVSVGAFTLLGGNDNLIVVYDQDQWDQLDLIASSFSSNGLSVQGMVASFHDSTASVFSSDALPILAPPLSAFDRAPFQIEAHRQQGDPIGFTVNGVIDNLFPEPCSLLLLLLSCPAMRRRSFNR